ncbi:MAG TPA: hypothetical protein VGI39_01330 [Polyangiaceae bacterium]|jgi:exonuclease SbcC
MRFGRFYAKGLGIFAEPFEVNLDDVPGPLVAVTGPNGCGKSTFLELLGAASVYRDTPTHGSLGAHARSRGAVLEVDVINGARYRIRHTVDGPGKGETLVTDVNGVPQLPDTKVSSFDAWAKKHFPPKEVTYASLLAAQESDGLLDMDPGPAKGVLLRVLGCEELETKAKRASERAREAKAAWQLAGARLKDEKARPEAVPVEEAESKLARAREVVVYAEGVASQAEEDLGKARAADEAHRASVREHDDAVSRRAVGQAALEAEQKKLEELRVRITNNEAVLAEEAVIRAAAARAQEIGARIPELRTKIEAARGEKRAAEEARARAGTTSRGAQDRRDAARGRAETADGRADARAQEASKAEAEVGPLKAEIEAVDRALAEASAEVERLQGVALVGAEGRIESLRTSLAEICAIGAEDNPYATAVHDAEKRFLDAQDRAASALAADDTAVAAARDTPALLRAAKAKETRARSLLTELRTRLSTTAARAAWATEVPAIREDAAAARREVEAAEREDLAAREDWARANALLEGFGPKLASLQAEIQALSDENVALADTLKKLRPLEAAQGRLEELRHASAQAREALAQREAELAAIEIPPVVGSEAPARLQQAAATHTQAVQLLERARAEVTRLAPTVTAAHESAARCTALEEEVRRAGEDLGDWTLLAESLGRDGLQALLIDAAGPELTAIVNDLLHNCHGPRFTMTLATSRLSGDGKKELDGLEISVLDTREGREASGKLFSGGEKTFLREALSLAIVIRACRASGAPTLIRDESGSALDPEYGRAYIAMLRRAAEHVGASRVLFVSHNPALVELADGVIDLGARAAKLEGFVS